MTAFFTLPSGFTVTSMTVTACSGSCVLGGTVADGIAPEGVRRTTSVVGHVLGFADGNDVVCANSSVTKMSNIAQCESVVPQAEEP